MSIGHDEAGIGQALRELVPTPPVRPDRFDRVAARARRGRRGRIAGGGLVLAAAATCGGYLLLPGGDEVVLVTPAAHEPGVLGCRPWPPPTEGVINMTPEERDPVTGKVSYPQILMPPLDPGIAAICEQLVPLVLDHPSVVTNPRTLATALHAAVRMAHTHGDRQYGLSSGETIRKDENGRWTMQLPGSPCYFRPQQDGAGEATYRGKGADIVMRVHTEACTARAEVTLVPKP